MRKIGPFFGADLGIRGQKLALQKYVAPLVDSEFGVDYDCAFKHDPIQSDAIIP